VVIAGLGLGVNQIFAGTLTSIFMENGSNDDD
jgi:hypothetical protein